MEPDEKEKDAEAAEQDEAVEDHESTETKDEQETTEEPEQEAPADALSRTPDELEEEQAQKDAEDRDGKPADEPVAKKDSALRRFFRRANVYFLIFLLILVITAIVVTVFYLNSQKDPEVADIANQSLTQDTLKQLANTDVSVGDTSQTLTIQGSAIISGQTLMRGNLNVAGNLQTGGSITAPRLTITGDTNLGATQINSLQVASNVTIQGNTSINNNLDVAGTSSFGGAMTASQITVSKLIMSGNAELQIPNHIRFTGPSPGRSAGNALGNGGTVSVNGSDTTGTVNVRTGGSPSAGCFVRVNFNQAFTTNPHVILTPIGQSAGSLNYYVDRDRNGFSICTNNAASGGKTFAFDYFVTG